MKFSQDLLKCNEQRSAATFFWLLDARQASIACAAFQQFIAVVGLALNILLWINIDTLLPLLYNSDSAGFDKRQDFKIGIFANIVVLCVKFIFHCVLIHAALTGRRCLLLPSLVLSPASLVYMAFKIIALLYMMNSPINSVLVLTIFFAVVGFGGYSFLTVLSLYNQLGYQDQITGNYNSLTPEPTTRIFRLATPPAVHSSLRDFSAIV